MKPRKRDVRPLIRRAAGTKDRRRAVVALAQALGVNAMTVHQWWRKEAIPRWWLDRVQALASGAAHGSNTIN